MPRELVQYRVFIGSPGGLQEEREAFRRVLLTFNEYYGEPNGILFAPVGWEDALGGVGRPQDLINEDLRACDFAIFVFHDRWGSPTGSGKTSGTEEEWELALELYEKKTIRKICLFFKSVDPKKLADPGSQLSRVLTFKADIEHSKKHLFRTYSDVPSYCTALEKHISSWMRDVVGSAGKQAAIVSQTPPQKVAAPGEGPSFSFWLNQSRRLSALWTPERDLAAARFCAEMALKLAKTDLEWADAENERAIALQDLAASFESFSAVAGKFGDSLDPGLRSRAARALINKGITLGRLGRNEEEIAVYENVIERFAAAREPALEEQVGRGLFNKGVSLGQIGRRSEQIATYDDVVKRYGTRTELPLRELVAQAQLNKGAALSGLGRCDEAIAVYRDVIGRFGDAGEFCRCACRRRARRSTRA
jgi:hypothetical protein